MLGCAALAAWRVDKGSFPVFARTGHTQTHKLTDTQTDAAKYNTGLVQ